MDTFEKALHHTLGVEGDFSNHPADPGGATRFGITERTARKWGYTGDMRLLPVELAKSIYREGYWDIIKLDDVAALSEGVAMEMFDTAVNCGPAVPVKFLQRLLNIFNREQRDYSDIAVDGLVGRHTIQALAAFLRRRGKLGAEVLVEALNSLQGAFYTDLAERRPANESFAFGWFSQRVLKRAKS